MAYDWLANPVFWSENDRGLTAILYTVILYALTPSITQKQPGHMYVCVYVCI